jgi:uncharacterized protein (TIGR03435 family)
MMRIFARMGLVALLSIAWIAAIAAAFGQSADPTPKTDAAPKFDVADVHVSAKSPNANQSGGFLRAGRYEIRKGTMVDLVRIAYGVDADKVLGGPAWLETDRFDIIAKAPQSTPPDTVKLMLQNLLADRFKLVVHKDTKPLAGYALTVGKGKPKMKEAEGSGSPGCQGQPQPAPPAQVLYVVVTCRNMSMETFAQNLRGMGGPYFNNPVVDQTGLKGSWDIDLKFTPRQLLANIGSDAISIFDAVDSQLGMKLDLQKIPTPVIVVDRVNQKPSDNPPGVSTSLPPAAPPEFEVANIKPSMPGAPQMARIQNNRVDAQSLSLKTLVQVAWDITDELMADAPKWMDSANFDVNAKVTTDGSGTPTQFDIDDLRGMLRVLLTERFQMKTHMETRPVSGYVLTAPKPKLQKADPENRMGCKEGPGADGKDPRIANPVLSRLLTCQNMTMARFAELLPQLANGYAHVPVLDSTGLDGAYDFTISFSAVGLLQSGGPGRGGDNPAAGVSDPNGALSLPDAINKQFGLKLELQKRPMQVLVIDHVEEKPTEN